MYWFQVLLTVLFTPAVFFLIDLIIEVYLEINVFSDFTPKPVCSVRPISQIIIYWTKNEQTNYCITGTNYITLSWEK